MHFNKLCVTGGQPRDHLLENADLKGTKPPGLIFLNSFVITNRPHTEIYDHNNQVTRKGQDGAKNRDREA